MGYFRFRVDIAGAQPGAEFSILLTIIKVNLYSQPIVSNVHNVHFKTLEFGENVERRGSDTKCPNFTV